MPSRWTRRVLATVEQQVELFGRFRQPGEEAARFPPRLRRYAGLAMDAVVVVLDQEAIEPLVQLRQRQGWLGRRRGARWRVAGHHTKEELVHRGEEALDAAPSARLARPREDQDHPEVGGDLFEVTRGEVGAVIGVEGG